MRHTHRASAIALILGLIVIVAFVAYQRGRSASTSTFVTAAAVSSDQRLAAGVMGKEGSLTLHDIATDTSFVLTHVPDNQDADFYQEPVGLADFNQQSLAFSDDGSVLVFYGKTSLMAWDTATKSLLWKKDITNYLANTPLMAVSGNYLVFSSEKGVDLVSLRSGTLVRHLYVTPLSRQDVLPEMYVASYGDKVVICPLDESGLTTEEVIGTDGKVYATWKTGNHGQPIITGSGEIIQPADYTSFSRYSMTGQKLGTIKVPEGQPDDGEGGSYFHPNVGPASFLGYYGPERTLCIYDGKTISTAQGISACSFGSTKDYILVGTFDGQISLLDPTQGTAIRTISL